MQDTISMFPFQHRIRESARAKQAQLHISEHYGLEVVIPKRLKNKIDILHLLQQKRKWIEKHLGSQPSIIATTAEKKLPDELTLRAIEENWSIHYITDKCWNLIENPLQQLTLFGDPEHLRCCYTLLISWLKRKAEIQFGSWLSELSQVTALPFRRFQIRAQQTRWGSCSAEGDISLNYQLLFLPPHLAKHILLHELVHTRYLNHGKRFWALLQKLDANTLEHAHQSKCAAHYVPRWIYMRHRDCR